jgi:hypothetical protein
MSSLASITLADVVVVLVLALLASVLWYARRVVAAMLRLLSAVAAIGGTWLAYELYAAGEHMGWDTPGSPGILVLYAALAATGTIALVGWVGVARMIRGLIRRGTLRSAASRTAQNLSAATAIVLVVAALFSAYRYYREHQPSHDTAVRALAFTRDGAGLYSLDGLGVLKRWDARRAIETDRWLLGDATSATALLVSGDELAVATLADGRVDVWRLATGGVRKAARLEGAVAIAPVDDERFAVVTRTELTLRAFANAVPPLAGAMLREPALTVAPYAGNGVVVGLDDSTLEFYGAGSAGLERRDVAVPQPLGVSPRLIRSNRTGRFIVVADGGTKLASLDLQTGRAQDIPLTSPLDEFDVAGSGWLLLSDGVALRGVDLSSGSGEPLFNHGGAIGALAVEPASGAIAIGERRNIWLRQDSRHYAAQEVWLKGAVQLSRLADAVLPGEERRR